MPRLNWTSIRKPIVTAIYATGTQVIQEWPCDERVEPNYHFVATSQFGVLVHATHRYVATIDSQAVPYGEPEFVDWPELSRVIGSYEDFLVLTADFLRQPVSNQMICELGVKEIGEIGYWKPSIVGHVIFNNWD